MNKVPCGLCKEPTDPNFTYTESEVRDGKVVGKKTYPVCQECRQKLEEGRHAGERRLAVFKRDAAVIDATLAPRGGPPP